MRDEHYDKVKKKYEEKLTQAEIDYNIEMIASEDEDFIQLFQDGLITKPELIALLK